MTKSIQELFDYIASSNFNPEMFKRALKEHKDLDVNLHVGSTKSTLLGQAARVLNVAAVEILLDDFHASPDALTRGEGAQVWTPVYWTAYNSDKSTAVDIANRVQVLDLLYDAGATMDPLMRTAEYKASCEPLISYVRGTVLEAFLLHGASPKHTTQRNVGESHITANTLSVLDSINASIMQNPANYLYIRALHPDVASKLPDDAKAKALEALKNGAAPKMGSTYTERAVKLLDDIAKEFIADPSLFLKTSLHPESKYLIEQDLVNLGSSLEAIASTAYHNLTHQAVDPKLAYGYTDNGANAIAKLAEELKANPTLLLYYTLHNNTTLEVAKVLQELGVTLKEVGAQAREALENGVSPVEEVDGEYTANAKAALDKIASNIKTDPMKFLYVTLHNDSISEISAWLDAHESSVDAIKAQTNAGLKAGKPIMVSDTITPNAIEAMTVLADELKADPKLWLHISLNDDVMAPLSEALVKTESSLAQVKRAAADTLKNGENPQTEGKYTDNAFTALATLKEELLQEPTQWLYIKLAKHSEQKLEALALDLDRVKAEAKAYLAHGGAPKMESALMMTPNSVLIITELASQYITDNAVPSDTFFHQDVIDAIRLQLTQSGKIDLIRQLKTLADKQVRDALNEVVQDEGHDMSTKDTAATKHVEVKAVPTTVSWLSYLWGAPAISEVVKAVPNIDSPPPNAGVKGGVTELANPTALCEVLQPNLAASNDVDETDGVVVSGDPFDVTAIGDAEDGVLVQESGDVTKVVAVGEGAPEEMEA